MKAIVIPIELLQKYEFIGWDLKLFYFKYNLDKQISDDYHNKIIEILKLNGIRFKDDFSFIHIWGVSFIHVLLNTNELYIEIDDSEFSSERFKARNLLSRVIITKFECGTPNYKLGSDDKFWNEIHITFGKMEDYEKRYLIKCLNEVLNIQLTIESNGYSWSYNHETLYSSAPSKPTIYHDQHEAVNFKNKLFESLCVAFRDSSFGHDKK